MGGQLSLARMNGMLAVSSASLMRQGFPQKSYPKVVRQKMGKSKVLINLSILDSYLG